MVTVSKDFSLSRTLLTSLQLETKDLVYFLKHAEDLKSKVRDMRERSEAIFHPLFTEGMNCVKIMQSALECPDELQNKRIGIIKQERQRILKRITGFLCLSHLWTTVYSSCIQRFLSHRKLLEPM